MPRKLLIINVLLLLIASASVAVIVRQLMEPMPMPLATRRPPAAAAPRAEEPPRNPAGAYTAVTAKNLFSPTRTESPPSATAGAAPAVKPNLFGVVLREGAPIAYLEDPTTKRVAGYRVGDSVAGGTVQAINADSVVITRPDGKMDVRLRDPGKPRPTPPPATAAAGVPGAQPVGAPLPGVIPPAAAAAAAPPAVRPPPAVAQPGQPVPPPAMLPGRRPLPPNLLRRIPQGQPADATQQ